MMMKRLSILLILVSLLLAPTVALAQDYLFGLPELSVDAYWNSDGSLSLDYLFAFQNDPRGHPIEYVDVALPTTNFDANTIQAWVNGQPVTDISRSGYEGQGVGVAVGLGQYSIPPGQYGEVRVYIARVGDMLFLDPAEDEYASAVFAPARFQRQVTTGTTDLTVTFHLPPGVTPEEPRWHSSPQGFPEEPETWLDEEGRVVYSWNNPEALPHQEYRFGASFPMQYVPDQAVQRQDPPGAAPIGSVDFLACLVPLFIFGFFGLIIFVSLFSARNRRLQYLPPKISIEGHGIKRGLTAIEAAILLEQPMDKIMTMILFATIKKNAAEVKTREPLELAVTTPLPEDLRPYEKDFLESFQLPKGRERQKALENTMVSLVKSVAQKMKGFSRRETVEYYRDIQRRAWAEVEAAETPEVKSAKFDEVMEWTMLDRDYDRRTRDVFRTGPVFVPMWWGRYDPTFGRSTASSGPVSTSGPSLPRGGPTGGGGGPALPTLPGGTFAASVVGGVQNFSSQVVGSMTDFTSRVTNQTNPVPKATTRSGGGSRGGGGGCACACACAGCACACAGGGR
jgi:hypothetical protein